MASLSDFKPLDRLTLPNLGSVACRGLILVVGPNSAGKTQLLHDIHQKMLGEPRKAVVAQEVAIKRLPVTALSDALVEAGLIYKFYDDNNVAHIRPLTTYIGSGVAAAQIQDSQLSTWHQNEPKEASPLHRARRDEYLGYLNRFLVTGLFLPNRLTCLNQTGIIDFIDQPPNHDLHALYKDDRARQELLQEIRTAFSKSVWPDISRGTGICLRVSDSRDRPTADERLSPTTMNTYRTIEMEGDGLKSYAATCIALLLGRRPVCLLDEPEMCLHPPQAYNLGQFIGRFGSDDNTATFVATHSSHILRGAVQTAAKLQIIRLTRLEGKFRAHLVPSEVLAQALTKPTVRAESVLDGIFAQGVVVVEADGDRTVYQATWETLEREFRLDVHFAAVGGTSGIADTCVLYVALRIPVAVIADLDIIADADRLRRVLDSLACPHAGVLVEKAEEIVALVKELPPTISPQEARASIMEVLPSGLGWAKQDEIPLRARLNQVSRKLDRMRRLKKLRTEPLPDAISSPLKELIAELHKAGLFVVPIGELEEWLHDYAVDVGKQTKWAWANAAALRIRVIGAKSDDIWEFMRSVGGFLQERLKD